MPFIPWYAVPVCPRLHYFVLLIIPDRDFSSGAVERPHQRSHQGSLEGDEAGALHSQDHFLQSVHGASGSSSDGEN